MSNNAMKGISKFLLLTLKVAGSLVLIFIVMIVLFAIFGDTSPKNVQQAQQAVPAAQIQEAPPKAPIPKPVVPKVATRPTNPELLDFVAWDDAVGCTSKLNKQKQEHIFDKQLKNFYIAVRGKVVSSDETAVMLKVRETTLISDMQIKLANPEQAYDLVEGQLITVHFKLLRRGGCFLDWQGEDGHIY